MNVIIFSTSSQVNSGKVVYELAKNLTLYAKYNVQVINLQEVIPWYKKTFIYRGINKVLKALRKVDKDYYFFDYNDRGYFYSNSKFQSKFQFSPDLVIISFYENFLKSKNFSYFLENINCKVLFWLMDMALFTGGCHYANNCINYRNNCGNCPALYSKKEKDQSYRNLENKKKNLLQSNFKYVCISTQQQQQAKSSALLKNATSEIILHSINFEIFNSKLDPLSLRKKYHIAADSKALLFIATNIEEKRKGFNDLIQALSLFDNLKLDILVIGKAKNAIEISGSNIQIKYFGLINNLEQIAEIIAASDVLVNPSLADSGPLTIMESLACGTPVISYDVGVANDIIKNGVNGFVTEKNDPNCLYEKLNAFFKWDIPGMRKNAATMALNMYQPKEQIEKWIEFIKR